MRIDASPSALVLAFVLGACTTVAVQSSASTDANTEAPAEPAPTASATATDGDAAGPGATVTALADAERRVAPSGKGSITVLARGTNAFLGQLQMDAGGAVPSHRDATEEYIHIVAGGGVMTIDGQAYEVEAGTTVFMPANAEVSFQNGDQELVALQVFAGPGPAAKYEGWTVAE